MLAERIEKWERELLAEGVALGRTAMLRRQFARRFGALPAGAERLIDAGTPSDVFPDHYHSEASAQP